MRRLLFLLLATAWLTSARAADAPARKPAILFVSPGEIRYAYIGFDYMRALAQAGFEVDYSEGARELTWERVQKFNVVVVIDFPAPGQDDQEGSLFQPGEAGLLDQYFGVLDRFRQTGGGVFLHYDPSSGGGAPNPLLQQWGVQFPLIHLRDSRVEPMPNLGQTECMFTDQVAPSPVSEGVRQVWWPNGRFYNAGFTMPILVDTNWQVVVRASKTAWTETLKRDRGGVQPPKRALVPTEPIKDPVLFAIRDGGDAGRLSAVQTWHQFSLGSGMKWFYDNIILSRGFGPQRSDYGQLLRNTYQWLAEPSLKSGAVGGFVTDPVRLTELQLRPGAREQLHEWYLQDLDYHRPPATGKLYRGLIGAQTMLSGGTGTVAEYAQAAAAAKLDFVIFLEDFSQLTPAKLETLKAETNQSSTPTLKLYAGYRLRANTGNHLFVCGANPLWPEPRMLAGAHKDQLNVQYQDEQGQWAQGNFSLYWCLNQSGDAAQSTVGYYKFTASGQGMKMYDLRAYSMAGLRTYENGKLVEDVTPDYLTTTQCTLGPSPVCVNLVRSPQELTDAVAQNQALTYGRARSLETLWGDALRWNDIFTGMNIFPSDGPLIQAWPGVARVITFGAEPFVTGRSLDVAPLHVTSTVGLKEIRIYDGQELFRRVDCRGATEYDQTLFLPAVIYRNLVVVAEDVRGGVAVSSARRSYKDASKAPMFCGDHVNDCGGMLLAHGPHWPMLFAVPGVPDAGGTWDGGPAATKPLLSPQFTYPEFDTTPPDAMGSPPYQIPLLEFADEGATRCRMVCNRRLIPALQSVPVNPWSGYGPLEPTTLADMWASHAYFDQYLTGVDPNSYGGPGLKQGPIASLFTQHIAFKKATRLNRLGLFHGWWRAKNAGRTVLIAFGRGNQIHDVLDATELPDTQEKFPVATGDWIALYSAAPANTHLLINRGPPVECHVNHPGDLWFRFWAARQNAAVQRGETCDTEFFAMTWPMDQRFPTARRIAEAVAYLDNPAGLRLQRGQRSAPQGGLLEIEPVDSVVELSVPQSPMPVVVPLRVSKLNRRWSVGLYQLDGYRTHYYSEATSGYRALGLDFDGRAYVPLYVSMATNTHVRLGHPIVADKSGQDLFIQVTKLSDKPDQWHVSVNNPTDHRITTKLRQTMELPGLHFATQKVTLRPGELRVLTPANAAVPE